MDVEIDRLAEELDSRLHRADEQLERQFPGERPGRQPVHTVYVPADRFRAGLSQSWGAHARAVLDEHSDVFTDVVAGFGLAGEDLVGRVRTKLASEPIEDLRIDFEDGYGNRGDDAEDKDAVAAARALAGALRDGGAPPFHGIRMKCLEAPTRRRALRTLSTFLGELVSAGASLDGFVITLPKVTSVDQVESMVFVCGQLEQSLALGAGALAFEIQVETPQSILGPDGTALVARMVHASDGRCTALHYGTYDYSAFCGIAAEFQSMAHPVADYAKLVMQAAAAGTGVRLSDGSTNILPVGDADSIRSGWQLHLGFVRRSLERGYYQGWDLHPAQLPTRYAATIGFYRAGLDRAEARLRNYVTKTESAILDEPATARALADFILRALHCGATTAPEIQAATSLGPEA
ncbi:MAG: aldolase, partial [Jatrophihabitantaceae bacterium]